jgi:hypothetical protein
MSAERNAGGFRLDDCRMLRHLHEQALYEISKSAGHTDEAAILRRTRVLAFWMVSTVEAAFGVDGETQAADAMNADLARLLAEHGHDGNDP